MALTAREMEMVQDTDVVAHIKRLQAKITAECEAQGATFFMVPTTKWAERGDYANVYEYELSMALNDFSDTHKEAYGFRPRGDYSGHTLVEIEAMIEELWQHMPETHEDDYQILEAWNAEQLNLAVDQLDENWDKYDALAERLGY